MERPWYQLADETRTDTPALLVYPDRVAHNITLLKSMIDDPKRLRPHVKTHKTREATRLLMEAGIRKFKCATLTEAAMLGDCGAPDVLLAFPLTNPRLEHFIRLMKQYPETRFAAIADDPAIAEAISVAAVTHGVTIPLYLDINLGMNRTGIRPGPDALALYRLCAGLPGLHVRGFHAYDGHVRETDLQKRAEICRANYGPLQEMIHVLKGQDGGTPEAVIGGSPSFPVYAAYPDVECSPGTFIFWDKGYQDTLPEQPFLPAAVLMTRVISLPDTDLLCLDLGYKAIASENPLERRVYFLNAPDLRPVSHSEEHMVVQAGAGHSWKVGDVLYGLPVHICPTVALYDDLSEVRAGLVSGKWSVVARHR